MTEFLANSGLVISLLFAYLLLLNPKEAVLFEGFFLGGGGNLSPLPISRRNNLIYIT